MALVPLPMDRSGTYMSLSPCMYVCMYVCIYLSIYLSTCLPLCQPLCQCYIPFLVCLCVFVSRDQETEELFVGRRYEGEWKNGKYDGRGIYMSGNGETYSGYFQKGLYHGEGTLRCKNEDMYIGEWVRGKAGGKMSIKYHDGSAYEGMTSGGRYHGSGKRSYHPRESVLRHFTSFQSTSNYFSAGKLIFPRGLGIYEGDWSRGKMHGKGSRSYSNGSKYIGGFRDGEPHGEGICMYVNGDQYIGEWASGFQTGRGKDRTSITRLKHNNIHNNSLRSA